MKFNPNTKYHQDKKRRRRIIFALVFFPTIGMLIGGHFIYQACHRKSPEIVVGIFDIQTIDGKVTLVGFKDGVTKDDIIKALGNTFTIPKEIQVIANNAFYRNGKTTIPSEITGFNWNGAKIESIGDSAFAYAPFNGKIQISGAIEIKALAFFGTNITSLVLSKENKIGTGAFAYCNNLKEIDLNNYEDHIPLNEWGQNVFAGENKSKQGGKILIKSNTYARNWKQYLENDDKQGFIIDNKEYWTIVPTEISIFKIVDNVLYGFEDGVTDEDIELAFPDHNLTIPEEVTSVNELAFCADDPHTPHKSIPDFIDKITFLAPQKITKIGAKAFWSTKGVTQININKLSSLSYIGNQAFANCEKLALFDDEQEELSDTLALSNIFALPGIESYLGDGAFFNCKNIKAIKVPNIRGGDQPTYVGTGVFNTNSDKLQTLDFSNLRVIKIIGEGQEQHYDPDSSMQFWMNFKNLFCFIQPTNPEPTRENKIILPRFGVGIDPRNGFLLAQDTRESYLNAPHSGFHWLCSMNTISSVEYLIESWDLVTD